MTTTLHDLVVSKVKARFASALESVSDFRGERTLFIAQSELLPVLQFLRDEPSLRFNMLEDIVADDYLDQFPRFYVSYQLYSIPHKSRVRVRVGVEDPDEGPQTAASLWNVATWLEMELYDLMGIRFAGNGGLRRLFLPQDWVGHPLRKDYPLGYEEVQFTFNYSEIDAKKPYAKE